jgi:DNA-binding CsgD family transcriptional regulator
VEDLVGREPEFAAIGAALRRPDLAGAVFVGDAGVGKSTLLDATLQHAESIGFVTVSITGTRALADIPLAAFAGLLPGRPVGDAGDLVQLRRVLHERAGGRPLLLGLDDAHLLDDASAAFAHQLATDLTAFVVGTLRTGEVPPEGITSLVKDALAVRIPVEPLPAHQLGAFARVTLGAPVTDDVADQLFSRTLGNPLFAREVLLGARDAGTLVLRQGIYEATGTLSAPTTLTQFVETRIAELDEVQQRAVALIAFGGPLEIELLEQLVHPDALVGLEDARLLVADERDDTLVVRFVHPVYSDAGRRVVGRLAARQLMRELADALERHRPRRPQDVLRIATWRLDGGSPSDPAVLADAVRLALERNDFGLAERLGLAWLDQVADGPDGPRAAHRVAAAFMEQGRFDEAQAVLDDPRLNIAAAPPNIRLRVAVMEAGTIFWASGLLAPALERFDRAEADLVGELPQAGHLLAASRAAVLAAAGLPDAAIALTPPGSPAAAAPAGAATNLLAFTTLGRAEEALAGVPDDPSFFRLAGGAITAAAYAFALVEAGRVRDAAEVSILGWERAVRDHDRHGQVAWSISLGWVDLQFGRRAAAAQWFQRSADLARNSAAAVHGTRWALGGLLLATAYSGDIAAATAVRDRLDAMPPHDARAHAYLELQGRAWLRALDGDPSGAIDDLVVLAADAHAQNRIAPWLRLLTDIARLDRPGLAAELLAAQSYDVDGTLLPLLAEAIRAIGARDAHALAATADSLAELGYVSLAAEYAASAWALLRDSGAEARLVAQFARRAQELRDSIDAHATPAFASAAPEVNLSRREREIALLVADGRTSREVADELIIGVRTVESHLARVYAKLGVRSRGELAEALGLLGARP